MFCRQEGDSTSVRSFASLHSLACVVRRQTVWFGTHTVPSAVHQCQQDCRLLRLRVSNSYLLVLFGAASEWSPAFMWQLQILCVFGSLSCSFSAGVSFSCDTSGSLQLLVFGSTCRAAAKQLCWSHMAVFAWWGFIASKMPRNVSQLTFSLNARVCVCVCASPSNSLQNNKLSLQFPSGSWSHTASNKGRFSFWRWITGVFAINSAVIVK